MELDYLNLLAVLLAGWLAGSVATRVGFPSVLGELIAGIVLGPALLGWLQPSDALAVLAEVGVLLMMLYIGMEIDPAELGKASWAGALASVGGFLTPFVGTYFAVTWITGSGTAGVIAGIASGGTSLAMKSRILVDLKLLDTRIAHAMMAAALITDTLLLVVFAGALGVIETGVLNLQTVAGVVAKAIGFFAVTAALGLYVFPLVGRRLSAAGLTNRTFNFSLVLILAVGFGELAHVAGLHAILGAFLAGLFLRDNVLGKTLSHDLMGAVREASIGFLAPIFFVTAGFGVSFAAMGENLGLLAAVVGIAVVGKIVGTVAFYVLGGNPWREGVAVSTGMNGRGAVEIIIAGIALQRDLISRELFSVLVFMAIFTTATVPVLLKWSADWLRRRGELVRSAELRRGSVILGAGPTARAMARALGQGGGPVWLIDTNAARVAAAEGEGLSVVRGNALQEQTLSAANAAGAQALIALTPNAEINALAAQLARNVFGVPSLHVTERRESYKRATRSSLEHLGADQLFGGPVNLEQWDHWIDGGYAAEATERLAEASAASDLFRRFQGVGESLPLAVRSGGEDGWRPFHSGESLRAGDEVLVYRRAVPTHVPSYDRRADDRDATDGDATDGDATAASHEPLAASH